MWNKLKGRLSEPSTYAGIAVLVLLITGVDIPPDMLGEIGANVVEVIAGVLAIIAMFKKDPGSDA